MTSKEIIKRLIAHDAPPRLGFDFADHSDILFVASRAYTNLAPNPYDNWGEYPELKELTGFSGETRRDMFGNIYGRFNGKTKGECIRGAIQDWDDYSFTMPDFDPEFPKTHVANGLKNSDKFVITFGQSIFSTLRDARLMPNALMDTVEYPEKVIEFVNIVVDKEIEVVKSVANCGIDAWMICDDLGMQKTTFISPNTFRELFKPAYKRLATAVHEAGMAMIMHSCGYNYGLMEDLIDAGIDVFQFDQPDAYPAEVLANEFAKRVVFYCPVDIQIILPTGDRALIENRAKEMCELFCQAGGGFIAKDYPTYCDIGVEKEWAHWAEDVILANSEIS